MTPVMGHRRRAKLFGIGALLVGAGCGGALFAQPGDAGQIIESDDPAALPPPERWDCAIIEPEYRAWLADGQGAQEYRYVGKTYRDAATGSLYRWDDWLAWRSQAACAPVAGIPADRVAVGTALTALGAGVLLASSGANAKSPG